jgi:hypothetical protein
MGAQKITRIKISAKFELVNQSLSLSLSLGAPSLSNHSLGNCSLLFSQCPELRNAIVVPLDDNPKTGCNCKLLRGCNCCPLHVDVLVEVKAQEGVEAAMATIEIVANVEFEPLYIHISPGSNLLKKFQWQQT